MNELEVWFVPSGGLDAEPVLLDRRPFGDGERPPNTMMFGGDVLLIAAMTTHRQVGDRCVFRVDMVDPYFVAPSQPA